jgi:hypothetical protein
MMKRTLSGVLVAMTITAAAAVQAQSPTQSGPAAKPLPAWQDTNTAPTTGRQLPQYASNGDLILPTDWRSWIYLGSPLTPDGLNDGKEGFPEFHNVYVEPGSFEIYKRTGEFPDGTILFKELQRTLKPADHSDGSQDQPSGRGYFPGAYNGADVTVKDGKKYAATGGWGYFNFHHYEPKAKTASARPQSECAYCHQASAKKDEVWTQFYPMLDR